MANSRVSSLCFGLVPNRKLRYSFSADPDQRSSNGDLVDGPYVVRVRRMPEDSSLSLSAVTYFSNIACSEANHQTEEVPSGHVVSRRAEANI